MYNVGVAHGKGAPVSEIYLAVSEDFATVKKAQKAAQEWQATNPEHDGWNAYVGVSVWNSEEKRFEWA
jgi:hypothetical protein